MKTLEVKLDSRSYPIYIGQGLLQNAELLSKHITGSSAVVVSNETVAPIYHDSIRHSLGKFRQSQVILKDGEQYKTPASLDSIYTHLLESRFDRGTTLLSLGGGVIGDITGYAAASYQRGIPFIQIPTTLLSQVDSSVGGKTGVNHPLGKNMIGAFYQPKCVIIDIDTLNTLPDRELSAGISEVIKYGIIRDPAFFGWLEDNMDKLLSRDAETLSYAILRSCENKADVVARDELEVTGQRALLNLGHTFGHAIETGLGYGKWLHGEAVSCGMVMAANLSHKLGWLTSNDVKRIRKLLTRAHLPVDPPREINERRFMELMSVDKKVLDGQLRLILLSGIGKALMTSDFDLQALRDVLAMRNAA